jgi:regulator of protease activity HflC (stomatin/prohibitin superfamily)
MQERAVNSVSGFPVFLIGLAVGAGLVYLLVNGAKFGSEIQVFTVLPFIGATIFMLAGLYQVEPNQAAVLSLFGRYIGTVTTPGLRWNNPLFKKNKVSLRVRNFESGQLKVNDLDGSPIEIAAVIVWQVVDSAEAVYNVDDYESFVQIQSEAAVRAMATSYPYDQDDHTDKPSLRSHPQIISEHLMAQIQERLSDAGVKVIEARISHLAYAPEIANAMLQRQQASAIIAARSRIVEGAVGMVQMALAELSSQNIVELDDERRAAMVSNLLTVLCADKATQPVVNTGSLY